MRNMPRLGTIERQNRRRREFEGRLRLTDRERGELVRLQIARHHRLRRIGAQLAAARARVARLEAMAVEA